MDPIRYKNIKGFGCTIFRKNANQITQQKVQDPLTKEGTVGLFNRVFFPVTRALDTFLSDVYEPTDKENRYHLIAASSMEMFPSFLSRKMRLTPR